MIENWNTITIQDEFSDSGISCYKLHGDLLNSYYIVSQKDTRNLMDHPEVVGYEVYKCLLPSTVGMLHYFKEKQYISKANILSILRGALNYPLEESCYLEAIEVHDISFMSCERVFDHGDLAGLAIKYHKVTTIDQSTLLIGDIIASGETLIHCLQNVLDQYRKENKRLRNIILFTIGGLRGVEIMESFTKQIRLYWPEFEGFQAVYYEGIFNCYEPGDKGVSGINRALIDFYWKDGIIAPEFREETLSLKDALFEKCTIYDGGARRYEIKEHIEEVLEFWNGILKRSHQIDFTELLEEKLGHSIDILYEEWIQSCHYSLLSQDKMRILYNQEKEYIASVENEKLEEIATRRIEEFTKALSKYKDEW